MVAVILGTRPEIIKLAPVIRALAQRRVSFFLIHTNQHYSATMDHLFFEELALPEPSYHLGIGSADHGQQTGRMLEAIEDVLQKERPDWVLVQGDTNTVLAGALAASKLGIPVAHVEAGLRSFDRRMPEEINRVVTDHLAQVLFAPTKTAASLLKKEGISQKKILITGNTVVDAVTQHRGLAHKRRPLLRKLDLTPQNYLLLTLHRPSNVDQRQTLTTIFSGLGRVSAMLERPIIFPIHPRTRKQLTDFHLKPPSSIRLVEPVGYVDFLLLLEEAFLVFTDSGGIQEEACVLGVPCVTIRDNTERPETLTVGANHLAGTSEVGIKKAVEKSLARRRGSWKNPFGNGQSAQLIVDYLLGNETKL